MLVILSYVLDIRTSVEYDYSYKGTFKKYKTFAIMQPANIADSSMVNDMIEKSIVSRMNFGIPSNHEQTHWLLALRCLKTPKFNGYAQPEIEAGCIVKEDVDYNPQKFYLNSGTCSFNSMTDAKIAPSGKGMQPPCMAQLIY